MKTTRLALRRLIILAGTLAACGSPAPSSGPAPAAATPLETAAMTSLTTVAPLPTYLATCQVRPGDQWVYVDAMANLFGAGLDRPPAPGGGGGGLLPSVITLPSGGARFVTFPCAGGVTDPTGGVPTVGPAGFAGPPTDVSSAGGISGMRFDDRVMFLAGVFISDAAPTEPAPERLDFTGEDDFLRLEPELGQTFYIGDGAGKTFVAPNGATRLYLGFVDAAGFVGEPGWYSNNRGALEATVAIEVD